MQLKDKIKQLAQWVLPPKFEVLFRARLRGLRNMRYKYGGCRVDFSLNRAFKNIHEGKRCFILATGPSISKIDLRPLSNELCISMSGFYLHKDISFVNPQYHVDAPNHAPFDFNLLRDSFACYAERLPKSTQIFLGHAPYRYSILDFIKANPQHNSNRLHHINYSQGYFLDEAMNPFSEKNWDIAANPFLCRSSLYIAIQLALYLGCKKVYLLGCDHNYIKDLESVAAPHFYAEPPEVHKSVKNFFDTVFSTEKWFLEYYRRWRDYRLMRLYAEKKGVEILNATEGSLIDVFKRVSYADLF